MRVVGRAVCPSGVCVCVFSPFNDTVDVDRAHSS